LDFWGKFRRGVESASASLGTQVATHDNALVSLTGEVARVYVHIRILEERIAVTRANIEARQQGYRLANTRYRAGATSALDPAQALTLLRNTQSQVPVLESQLRQTKNALSILPGMPPRDLGNLPGTGSIPDAPAEIAVGVPAELMHRGMSSSVWSRPARRSGVGGRSGPGRSLCRRRG